MMICDGTMWSPFESDIQTFQTFCFSGTGNRSTKCSSLGIGDKADE